MSGLHTEARGGGPTLVLLHGWGLNVRVWDGLAAALSDRFRLVAVDLPGHGRSAWLPERASLEQQAEQVQEALAAIAAEHPAAEHSLLGWSLGGQIALQLAAAQRARKRPGSSPAGTLRRLVLIATTPRFTAGPDWPHGAPPERLAALAAGLETDYRRTVSDFLELQVRGSERGTDALAHLRAALFAHGSRGTHATGERDAGEESVGQTRSESSGPQPAALASDLELLRNTDLRPRLAGITAPTLVIAGQYDRVTLPAASRALADSLPNARYVEFRRAAHAPFLSHLPELAELLADFLLHP